MYGQDKLEFYMYSLQISFLKISVTCKGGVLVVYEADM